MSFSCRTTSRGLLPPDPLGLVSSWARGLEDKQSSVWVEELMGGLLNSLHPLQRIFGTANQLRSKTWDDRAFLATLVNEEVLLWA